MVRLLARCFIALVLFAFTLTPQVVRAQAGLLGCALYAASSGQATSTPPSRLVELYPSTGAILRVVGTLSVGIGAMAQDPTTGIVYGTTSPGFVPPSGTTRNLVIIDLRTAQTTTVGPLGATGFRFGIADLAFRSDGTLFAWSENSDDLITINKSTGAATIVSNAGISTFGSGLEFDAGGRLILTGGGGNGNVYQINPTTGLPTLLGSMTGAPGSGFPVNALSLGPDGTLWGSNFLSFPPTANAHLIRFNSTTLVATDVGASLQRMDSLAWICQAPAIPTMSQWLTWLLAATLIAVSAWQIRRRRHVMI
jgi:WD40 repeat protein